MEGEFVVGASPLEVLTAFRVYGADVAPPVDR